MFPLFVSRLFTLLAVLTMSFAAGCEAPGGEDLSNGQDGETWHSDTQNVGKTEQGIINGTVMPAENSGYVLIGGCTGTLITNDWILTSGRCLADSHITNPSTITVTYGAQSRTADWAGRHPRFSEEVDVALIHVAAPFAHNGGTSGYKMRIYADSTASLVGKRLFCAGYGNNTSDSGFGTLRLGLISVGSATGMSYYLYADASGQIPWLGDWGGSCQLDVKGGRLITGVTSGVNMQVGLLTSAEYFRDWVLDTIYSRVRFGANWPAPLPNSYSSGLIWNPCGNGCFTWTAAYSFEQGYDYGFIGSQGFTGSGTSTGTTCGSPIVSVSTDGSVQSAGFTSLLASCQSALECHGPLCRTAPRPLPNNASLSEWWFPCPTGCYTWTASYNLEPSYDFLKIDGQSYTGNGIATGSSCSFSTVQVTTDFSVQSPGITITAVCEGPSGPCHTENACGTYSSSGACWCDQSCLQYGDCCSDGPC